MTYDNSNSGMLARNDKKETEKHPDFKGSINVDGVEYWLSAWVKEGKPGGKMEGRKFFSLSVSPKEQILRPRLLHRKLRLSTSSMMIFQRGKDQDTG
jgi:hypothetical protein